MAAEHSTLATSEIKTCTICGLPGEFRKHRRHCRTCERKNSNRRHAQWRASLSPERKQQWVRYKRHWHVANWSRTLQNTHLRATADTAQRKREYFLEYYKSHKEDIAAHNRAHPEGPKANNRRRRARLKGAVIRDLTAAQWQEILATFNYCCAYCLASEVPLHQDHMRPLSRGGDHTATNVVPACQPCNQRKHAKTLLEFVVGKKLF